MTQPRRALLLVGSPKPNRSTSEVLGSYLLEKLSKEGFSGEKIPLHQALLDKKGMADLLASASDSDLVILAFPTYVDSLPAPVIRILEKIAEFRRTHEVNRRQRFLAIANCGFPESVHNVVSLAICRRFAKEAEFAWAGGMSLGGGGVLDGQPLRDRKGMARNIIRALDITAAALAGNRPIPEAAIELMARPLVPRWLYLWAGSRSWKRQAKQFGTRERLRDRPWPN
jgi:hypothetical protein